MELTGRVLVATTKSCRESQGASGDVHNGSKSFTAMIRHHTHVVRVGHGPGWGASAWCYLEDQEGDLSFCLRDGSAASASGSAYGILHATLAAGIICCSVRRDEACCATLTRISVMVRETSLESSGTRSY